MESQTCNIPFYQKQQSTEVKHTHMEVRPTFKSWSHHYRLCGLREAISKLSFQGQREQGSTFFKGLLQAEFRQTTELWSGSQSALTDLLNWVHQSEEFISQFNRKVTLHHVSEKVKLYCFRNLKWIVHEQEGRNTEMYQ